MALVVEPRTPYEYLHLVKHLHKYGTSWRRLAGDATLDENLVQMTWSLTLSGFLTLPIVNALCPKMLEGMLRANHLVEEICVILREASTMPDISQEYLELAFKAAELKFQGTADDIATIAASESASSTAQAYAGSCPAADSASAFELHQEPRSKKDEDFVLE